MNLALWLERAAKAQPGDPALLYGDRIIASYAEFALAAAEVAAGLRQRFEIVPGDRVAIVAQNDPAYLVWLHAIWWAGAVAVPINYKLHATEVAWIISNSAAKLVACSSGKTDGLKRALGDVSPLPAFIDLSEIDTVRANTGFFPPHEREASDMAWLFYTSGTTGRPKGVIITHGNLQAMAYGYLADVDVVSPSDAAVYAAPLSHGAGLYSVIHTLKGARHVVPKSGGFDAAEILELASLLQNVHLFAAPTMVNRLVREAERRGARGDGIRSIIYGGGPMYVADIGRALDVMGDKFIQIYGQGECPMTITTLSRTVLADRKSSAWTTRAASVGRPQSCVEVRIADATGRPVPIGEAGEILVRGAPVMAGYFNDPEATARTLRDGWLWTGDIGSIDEAGYLSLIDRSKDVIISGGSNIYPREVEEVLLTCPGVSETSVIGIPDAEWGETVVAFVVATKETTADELDAICQQHIARFKRPRRYVFVDDLPKNSYGKVLKTELRARVEDHGCGAASRG